MGSDARSANSASPPQEEGACRCFSFLFLCVLPPPPPLLSFAHLLRPGCSGACFRCAFSKFGLAPRRRRCRLVFFLLSVFAPPLSFVIYSLPVAAASGSQARAAKSTSPPQEKGARNRFSSSRLLYHPPPRFSLSVFFYSCVTD